MYRWSDEALAQSDLADFRCSMLRKSARSAGNNYRPGSDPQRAAESPGGIIRFRTVVIREDMVVAAVTKEGAAEFSDVSRSLHPARRFRIELSRFLQLPVLSFG